MKESAERMAQLSRRGIERVTPEEGGETLCHVTRILKVQQVTRTRKNKRLDVR